MTKEQFINLTKNVILPLFTGAQIVGEEISSGRDSEVAQGANGAMLLKPNKQDEYRLIIKRNQPFKNKDISLVKFIMTELMLVDEYEAFDGAYKKNLQSLAIEKAICKSLSEESSDVLLELIEELTKWAERTYEGRNLTFGIVVNEQVESRSGLHFTDFIANDFMALLSDGKLSTLELDKNGNFVGYSILERLRAIPTICPQSNINFAKFCNENKIGVTLYENGDMLLFKNYALQFARRRGVWNSYDHEAMIDLLSNKTNHTMKEIRKSIYITALDVSFTRDGGCIVYLNKDDQGLVMNHIDMDDILSEKHYILKKELERAEQEKLYNLFNKNYIDTVFNLTYSQYLDENNCLKAKTLRKIINGRKFHELNRKLRQELVGMDGATIVDYDGTIVAIGAIIKIEAGSTGGGRLAATKTLSRYGVSIKISTDGVMQGFVNDKRTNTPKPIFSIG